MDRDTFERHLREATSQSVEFARRMVRQSLPDDVAYLVCPNQSYDGNPRVEDETIFPEDTLAEPGYHGPWTAGEVVSFLWRGGKVPEWIDVAVVDVDSGRTLIQLLCCGRFSAREELLYYNSPGCQPPFGIKSPPLPRRWENVEASGRFDLDFCRARCLHS